MKENEPELFAKINKIMLPKDYLAYKLSGTFCTDYSDASGMLLLDVQNKCWSQEMIDICGIREEQLPKLFESYEVVGSLKQEIAEELGLSKTVKVIAGAGIMLLRLSEQEQLEMEDVSFTWTHPEQFLFPVNSLE